MSRRWFITGGTPGGFGVAFAEAALETGDRVVLTSRRPQELATWAEQYGDRVLVVPLDVTDAAQVSHAVRAAEEHFGGIDVLVNNAGRGWFGSIEAMDESSVRAMFELNFFAVLSVTRAVLSGMRARGDGWIVNVSSVAGLVAAPGFGYYSATKFAIEAVTDALRDEVAGQGISVLAVEPGAFRTNAYAGFANEPVAETIPVPRHAGAGPRRLRRDGRCATRRSAPRCPCGDRGDGPGPAAPSAGPGQRRIRRRDRCAGAEPGRHPGERTLSRSADFPA